MKSECIRLASGDGELRPDTPNPQNALDDGTLSAEQHAVLERAMETVVLADGGSLSRHPRRGGEDGHGGRSSSGNDSGRRRGDRGWRA